MCTLVMALLGRDLTRAQIAERVRGYPPGADSMRLQLIRDIDALKDEGVNIRKRRRADGDFVYRIEEDEFYLPALNLTSDEKVALAAAAAAVDLGNGTVRSALLQLGGVISEAALDVAAVLPEPGVLDVLWQALGEGATAMFSYDGTPRTVDPWGVVFERGWWYLVGFDQLRGARRTFRVDRIQGGARIGGARSTPAPEGFDVQAAVPKPWKLPGDGEYEADVIVDAAVAATAIAELGGDARVEERADGSVRLRFLVSHPDAFRGWVLGLLDHAEVVGPPALRETVVRWLASMVGT